MCQNRERTGIPARDARVWWWMRPIKTQLEWLIPSLPLRVLRRSTPFAGSVNHGDVIPGLS